MTPPNAIAGSWRLAGLADGYLTTQLLHVAAELRLADVLADGPADGSTVAEAVGADPDIITRILRGLCAAEVFAEDGAGRFALGPLGEYLRDGVPGSQRGPILARGAVYYAAAQHLLRTARTGANAFEQAYGEPFFAHLQRVPAHREVFEASMAGRAAHEAEAVVAAYDLTGIGHLVDVGAGPGVMARAALRAVPSLTATLVDRPATLERARAGMADAGLTDRCTFVAADFFESVPGGGDAYLLSRILHDWDDDDAVRILRQCRAAMPAHARLLVVDAILPDRPATAPRRSGWIWPCCCCSAPANAPVTSWAGCSPHPVSPCGGSLPPTRRPGSPSSRPTVRKAGAPHRVAGAPRLTSTGCPGPPRNPRRLTAPLSRQSPAGRPARASWWPD